MNQKIEKEIRFVMTSEMYQNVKKKVQENLAVMKYGYSAKELTVMYDNPNPQYTFYSPQIDGRLRLRCSSPSNSDFVNSISDLIDVPCSLLTWKQRIPEYAGTVCKEKEIEVSLLPADIKRLEVILEDVLHCPRISSYERIRETFYSNGIEIAIDTFPYGTVIELEIKEDHVEEGRLYEIAALIGLNNNAVISTLSCDDMYKLLCNIAGIKAKSDILFEDDEMPTFDKYLSRIKRDEGGVINDTSKNCNTSNC